MEPVQHLGMEPLTATLFTAAGKIAVAVAAIDHASASFDLAALDLQEGCAPESIAILTRHGLRLFGTLRQDEDGQRRIAFDDPLLEWQRDRFIGRSTVRRPIVIRERVAA